MEPGSDLKAQVTVVIPAYNEAGRIGPVIVEARQYADTVIVVDDGSRDETATVAEAAGARVIRQANGGYIAAIKRGFSEASGDVVITLDADGEHDPADIPRLANPILTGKAEIVLGRRAHIDRPSERFLNWLARRRVKGVSDTGTGLRAMRRDVAQQLELAGRCICGISVLEPASRGARVTEIPIELRHTTKPRRIAWYHLAQTWYVLKWLIKMN